jgi:hypothetical protein
MGIRVLLGYGERCVGGGGRNHSRLCREASSADLEVVWNLQTGNAVSYCVDCDPDSKCDTCDKSINYTELFLPVLDCRECGKRRENLCDGIPVDWTLAMWCSASSLIRPKSDYFVIDEEEQKKSEHRFAVAVKFLLGSFTVKGLKCRVLQDPMKYFKATRPNAARGKSKADMMMETDQNESDEEANQSEGDEEEVRVTF